MAARRRKPPPASDAVPTRTIKAGLRGVLSRSPRPPARRTYRRTDVEERSLADAETLDVVKAPSETLTRPVSAASAVGASMPKQTSTHPMTATSTASPSMSESAKVPAHSEVVFSVSELVGALNVIFQDKIGRITVKGEISNFSTPRSGHFYLRLKDAAGVLDAAFFKPRNQKIDFVPSDGMKVVCRGKLNVYPAQGRMQLVIEEMEQVGIGELALSFQRLRRRLTEEGLFDPTHKQPLPTYPRCVALICSPTGAAVRDLIHVLRRRSPSTRIVLAPCNVQGPAAAPQIVRAIQALHQQEDIDLIILGRGGGSIEDLWAFNEEALARAIFASKIPILSGVGHETDFTIADFVADKRAPTPSAAAEIAVPESQALIARFEAQLRRMRASVQQSHDKQRLKLETLRLRLRSPQDLLQLKETRLTELRRRLRDAIQAKVETQRREVQSWRAALIPHNPRLTAQLKRQELRAIEQRLLRLGHEHIAAKRRTLVLLASQLDALSPLKILQRGYALVYDADAQLLRSATDTEPGDMLRLQLHEGEVHAQVTSVAANKTAFSILSDAENSDKG